MNVQIGMFDFASSAKTLFMPPCGKALVPFVCSLQADLCQGISGLIVQEQTIFGNMINIALEKSTKLRKYDFYCTLIQDWYKI